MTDRVTVCVWQSLKESCDDVNHDVKTALRDEGTQTLVCWNMLHSVSSVWHCSDVVACIVQNKHSTIQFKLYFQVSDEHLIVVFTTKQDCWTPVACDRYKTYWFLLCGYTT